MTPTVRKFGEFLPYYVFIIRLEVFQQCCRVVGVPAFEPLPAYKEPTPR